MTYEMPGRQDRSVGARIQRRGAADRLVKQVQEADFRRERMTCRSAAVDARFSGDSWRKYSVDTGNTGRNPVITDKDAGKIIGRDGVRWSVGAWAIATLAVILAIVLLADVAEIGFRKKDMETLEGKITAVTASNAEMSARLAQEASDASICVNAVNLNLVSSSTIEVIRLTVPDDATLFLRTANSSLDTAGLATILGD
ncbi:MAG: hypothetical protein Q4G19_03940 [Clostridia bacterium]|nr:hypothetical protein [Clostridia bacterium]